MDLEKIKALAKKQAQRLASNKTSLKYLIAGSSIILFYTILVLSEGSATKKSYHQKANEYEKGRIIGRPYGNVYKGKEKIFSKKLNEVGESQKKIHESIKQLAGRLNELENNKKEVKNKNPKSQEKTGGQQQVSQDQITTTQSSEKFNPYRFSESGITSVSRPIRPKKKREVLSFPVKSTVERTSTHVSLPSGSYVKAKLMTGIEAPEGKTYPVLLQLDFAHILPNNKRLDLSGCFIIAKAQGDLSTERVQMQASKLSCVSKSGKMFERGINGFVADNADNSFAVIGKVNSKQDRVAAMAFLSSIVEGVGKAIQQAQVTQSTNAVGGSQSVLSGNQQKYIAAGGASQAASMITQWYLKQAQGLLPTINVGSGRDVWIVLAEKVRLPQDYFYSQKSGDDNETLYSYFTNILR